MARPNKPWYRHANDCWYATIHGKKVKLATGKDSQQEARKRFHALMSQEPAPAGTATADDTLTVQQLIDAFTVRMERELKPATVKRYGFFLRSFAALFGTVVAAALHKRQVEAWVVSKRWEVSTHATAKATLVSVYEWAVKQELLASNPLKGIKKPRPRSRGSECLISPEDHTRLVEAASPALRLVLAALHDTGARPGEVLSVEAKDFDAAAGVWILHEHKTSERTGTARIVVLTPTLVQLCRELATQHPTGPLFRSGRGNPWKAITVSNRVLELRKRLGIKGRVFPYGYRHTFATDALTNGVPDAHVAALLGHTSTAMIHRHYAHLEARTQALREAVNRVR